MLCDCSHELLGPCPRPLPDPAGSPDRKRQQLQCTDELLGLYYEFNANLGANGCAVVKAWGCAIIAAVVSEGSKEHGMAYNSGNRGSHR